MLKIWKKSIEESFREKLLEKDNNNNGKNDLENTDDFIENDKN